MLRIVAPLLLLVVQAFAADAPRAQTPDRVIPLFNGRDLTGLYS